MPILALAELNFSELNRLALCADDSFGPALAFADWLLEILSLFDGDNQAGLLHSAIKSAHQVLD